MKYLLAALFILLNLKTEISLANHAVGADLTYECLGGNNYRFHFTLYRDCTGVPVSPFYQFSGTSVCGDNVPFVVNLDSFAEVPHTCLTQVTNCVNSASLYMGVEVYYFHGDVLLPSICNFWIFGPASPICNRNAAINNLTPNGASYCLYVEATLNNNAVQCNNSPTFGSLPVQFLCANQLQFFTEQTYDVDGDSIIYEMITPHSDVSTDVQYVPGLSATQPVFFIDSTQFNPQSGGIQLFPDGPQITVIAIQVNEYRNGILIGSVERDIELIFENCNNNIPTASGINGSIDHVVHVCADSILEFFIVSSDADTSQQTYLAWNSAIPGAIFTTSGSHRDSGYFYWQPGMQDVSPQAYNFIVEVKDDACPSFGTSIYSFSVYVDSCAFTFLPEGQGSFFYTRAYFSPSHKTINLKFKLDQPMESSLSLYDISGRCLECVSLPRQSDYTGSLDVSGFSPGLYFLNINTEEGFSKTLKVIVE